MNALDREAILKTMKLGLYMVTKDVVNPKPDRRVKHDWRDLPIVPEGTLLALREYAWIADLHDPNAKLRKVLVKAGGYEFGDQVSTVEHIELFDALLGALKPYEPQDVREALIEVQARNKGTDYTLETLDTLVAAGKITLDDVKRAAVAVMAAMKTETEDETAIEQAAKVLRESAKPTPEEPLTTNAEGHVLPKKIIRDGYCMSCRTRHKATTPHDEDLPPRIINNNCDGNGTRSRSCTPGEVRRLPISKDSGSNLILCHACFDSEIEWRKKRNKELSADAAFDLPTWESLEVYAP